MRRRRAQRITVVAMSMLAFGCKPPAQSHPDELGQAQDVGASELESGEVPAAPVSSEQICDHVFELMMASFGPAQVPEQEVARLRGNCVQAQEAERERLGDAEFNRQAECVLAAASIDEMERCESGSPSNREICEHVIDIMQRDAESKGAKTRTPAEVEAFLAQCEVNYQAEHSRLGASEVEAQSRCVMAAASMAELLACDKSSSEPEPEPEQQGGG